MTMLELTIAGVIHAGRKLAVRSDAVTAVHEGPEGSCWVYFGEGEGFQVAGTYETVRDLVFPPLAVQDDIERRTRQEIHRRADAFLAHAPIPAPEELGCDPLAFEKLSPVTPRKTP